MPSTLSLDQMQQLHPRQEKYARIARNAVLNGLPIPADVASVLEARGVDVGELEQRIRQNMGFVR